MADEGSKQAHVQQKKAVLSPCRGNNSSQDLWIQTRLFIAEPGDELNFFSREEHSISHKVWIMT